MGCNENSAKRKVHRIKCLHEKLGAISYKQLKTTPASSRIKRNTHTKEEWTPRNNQTEG